MALSRQIVDWNYGGDPIGSQVDRIRVLVGDTDDQRKLISDSEIEYFISLSQDDHEAAYRTALAIQSWAATHVTKSGGGYDEQLTKIFEHYGKIAARELAMAPLAVPKAPQLRRTDRDRMQNDSDLIQPQFSVGMLSEDSDAVRSNHNDLVTDDPFES